MCRDMDCAVDRLDKRATTRRRDTYFEMILNLLDELSKSVSDSANGYMFWSFAGEGSPENPEEWIGDPPHEPRGWYSVYGSDSIWKIVESSSKNHSSNL